MATTQSISRRGVLKGAVASSAALAAGCAPAHAEAAGLDDLIARWREVDKLQLEVIDEVDKLEFHPDRPMHAVRPRDVFPGPKDKSVWQSAWDMEFKSLTEIHKSYLGALRFYEAIIGNNLHDETRVSDMAQSIEQAAHDRDALITQFKHSVEKRKKWDEDSGLNAAEQRSADLCAEATDLEQKIAAYPVTSFELAQRKAVFFCETRDTPDENFATFVHSIADFIPEV